MSGILKHVHTQSLGHLMDDNGKPNLHVIKKLVLLSNICHISKISTSLSYHFNMFLCRLFHKVDLDKNQSISRSELRALIIGLKMGEIDLDKDGAVDKVMNEFDTSHDDNIQEEEFIEGISKWINEAYRSVAFSGSYSQKLHHFHMVSSFFDI